MKFITATPAPVEKITIVIKDQTISSKEMIVVRHSWTHPNDSEIRKGVIEAKLDLRKGVVEAKFDLRQSTRDVGCPVYNVTGTRADLELLKVELDSAYGLTAPEVAHNA